MPIWATYGLTESGDDLPVLLWNFLPSNEAVDAAYRDKLPVEYEEVGYVNWNVVETEYVQ